MSEEIALAIADLRDLARARSQLATLRIELDQTRRAVEAERAGRERAEERAADARAMLRTVYDRAELGRDGGTARLTFGELERMKGILDEHRASRQLHPDTREDGHRP